MGQRTRVPSLHDHMEKTVLAFGELLWDLLPSGRVLGGAPANFAYRVNSLGERGLIVSRVGIDPLGQSAVDQLAALGMETSYLQRDDHYPTGTVRVQLDSQGNPDFFIVPGVAYDWIECTEALRRAASKADCLCFGTLVQRTDRSRHTLGEVLRAAPQALKLLDINLRKDCYTPQTIGESLEHADILKLNEQEAAHLAGLFQLTASPLDRFAEEALRRWDLSHCLITLGERGAFMASSFGEKAYSPGYRVRLADTCGSGDACSAGFLHGLLQGEPVAQCLQLGNALGALVATQPGATQPISAPELSGFLASPPERVIEPGLKQWIAR
jgi:fructokinase